MYVEEHGWEKALAGALLAFQLSFELIDGQERKKSV